MPNPGSQLLTRWTRSISLRISGKQRIPTVLAALSAVGVPACVIVDVDVLREKDPLRRIYERLGGNWSEVEGEWRATVTALEQKSPPLTSKQVQQEVTGILSAVTGDKFPEDAAERIRKALKASSPWAPVKAAGLRALPSGEPMRVARRLLDACRKRGPLCRGLRRARAVRALRRRPWAILGRRGIALGLASGRRARRGSSIRDRSAELLSLIHARQRSLR